MPDYFFIHDADPFERLLRPALAASWQRRSFVPCRQFCLELLPRIATFTERYHLGDTEPLIRKVADGLPFDRTLWRSLVGEILIYAAIDIPEFSNCLDTLCFLIAPEQVEPLRQVHLGSRDLTFGSAIYRPDACGYNNAGDVQRLSVFLDGVDSSAWKAEDLTNLDEAERVEELAFARDWFPSLHAMYRKAAAEKSVVIREFV